MVGQNSAELTKWESSKIDEQARPVDKVKDIAYKQTWQMKVA